MSARQVISQESILDAALVLVREGGWAAVSARSLANRLGSSTMPIYSVIGSMEELKRLVAARAASLLADCQHQPRSENPLLDLALGYVIFAREEPGLFRLLSEVSGEEGDQAKAVAAAALDPGLEAGTRAAGSMAETLAVFSAPQQKSDFVLRTWIFTYGLAELVSGGKVRMDEAEIARHLEAAGGAFYVREQQEGGHAG